MKENIIFFGGTFNPIHIGHMILAQSCLDQVEDVSKVIFIPNGNPPHKYSNIPSAYHRLQMCKLSIDGCDNFEIDDYECEKETSSYTLETIRYLKKKYNIDKPYWLVGFDNLTELTKWYRIDELVKECIFILGFYPNDIDSVDKDRWMLQEPYASYPFYRNMETVFITMPEVKIRSTAIRSRIYQNMPIRYMVTDKVLEYIKDNNLYTDDENKL